MIDWDKTYEVFGVTEASATKMSRIIAKCDCCETEYSRYLQQYKLTTKKRDGVYLCHPCVTKSKQFKNECSERAKIKWSDPSYANKNKLSTSSDSYRELQRAKSRDRWADEAYRSKVTAKLKQANSNRAKKAWSCDTYRDKMSSIISARMIEQWSDDEYRSHIIECARSSAKNMWANGRDELLSIFRSNEFRQLMSGISSDKSPETIAKIAKSSKALWQNEKYRNKMLSILRSDEMRAHLSYMLGGRSRPNHWAAGSFVDKANEVHRGQYDYSESVYNGSKDDVKIICPTHGAFYQTPNNHLRGTRCPRCASRYSAFHNQVADFVSNYETISVNDRKRINPFELDIFIDSKMIGIELDGLYWHSFASKCDEKPYKHAHKADICAAAGIRLIAIREDEWHDKSDIVKSMILSRIGCAEKIHGRKCRIVHMTNQAYRKFMDDNHLYGHKSAFIKLGLEYNGEIMMAMSFSKNAKFQWEIARMASSINHMVVGGVSKLLCEFIKLADPDCIVTYADRRYSSGDGYIESGFKLDGITRPGYYYVKDGKVLSRLGFQKHKLPNILNDFDENKTEADNMFANGYRRLWDYGHMRFIWTKI